MTIGIYSLYWEEQDLIYIGQSVNIERRLQWHISNLKHNMHTNYKVQNAYNSFGTPTHNILEVCKAEDLNILESVYTDEFNSINNGLNIIEAGHATGYGYNCSASKYSREELLKAFTLLVNTTIPYKDVSKETGVAIGTIESITKEYTHSWLKEEFPLEYQKMLDNRISRKQVNKSGTILDRHGKLIEFIDPSGNSYIVGNITGFCKTHAELNKNISASTKGLNRLSNNTAKTYKGWKIREPHN